MNLMIFARALLPLFFLRMFFPMMIFIAGYMFKGNEAYVSEKIGLAMNHMIEEIKQGVDRANEEQDPLEEKLKVLKERLDAQIKTDREAIKEEG